MESILIVLAIFCLVIAVLFTLYPESIIPIWVEIPIAMVIGYLVYRKRMAALPLSLIGVGLLYLSIVGSAALFDADACALPAFAVNLTEFLRKPAVGPLEPAAFWMVILLVYAFVASVMPVWRLLQPRDYINGHELFVVLFILTAAIFVSHPSIVAPAFDPDPTGVTLQKGAVLESGSGDKTVILEKKRILPVLEETEEHYVVGLPAGSEVESFILWIRGIGEEGPWAGSAQDELETRNSKLVSAG